MSSDQSGTTLHKLRAMLDSGYIEEDMESSKSKAHKTLWNAPLSFFISKTLGDNAPLTANEAGSLRGGLEHLADAAVGNGPNGEAADWTTVGAKGFLSGFE